MKRMRIVTVILVALAVVMVGTGLAVGSTYFWRGTDGVGDWENPSDWQTFVGPCYPGCNGNTGDDAIVSIETTNEITIQEDNTIDDLVISKNITLIAPASTTVTLTLDSVHISAGSGGSVTFTVDGHAHLSADLTVVAIGS